MTRTVIRTTCRNKLGESTAVFWSDALINQFIEDAQLNLVWKCKLNRTRSTATSVANTVRYTLSNLITNCLRIYIVRIYNSSTTDWRKLTFKTQDWLDRNYPTWNTQDANTPLYYVYDVNLDEFIMFPSADSDHVGTDYIEFYASIKPTAISADTGSPDLPDQLHPAIIDYVVATGLESRGYADIARNEWQKYYSKIKDYQIEEKREDDEELIMIPSR